MTTVKLSDGTSVPAGTIFCIARNFFRHALELGNDPPSEPLVFLKATQSLRALGHGGVAFPDETFHHEAEVVLMLGRDVGLGESVGWDAVSAVALGLDLTRRRVQSRLKSAGLPWTTSKSFAGSAPVGPFVPLDHFADPQHIAFSLFVGSDLRQQGRLDEMTFSVPELLTFLAGFTELRLGDLVFTGTPEGVGEIRAGDRFVLRFDDQHLAFEGLL